MDEPENCQSIAVAGPSWQNRPSWTHPSPPALIEKKLFISCPHCKAPLETKQTVTPIARGSMKIRVDSAAWCQHGCGKVFANPPAFVDVRKTYDGQIMRKTR